VDKIQGLVVRWIKMGKSGMECSQIFYAWIKYKIRAQPRNTAKF